MNHFKFCVGVIWFNPDKKAIARVKALSEIFDKVFIYDNSSSSNASVIPNKRNVYYLFNGKNNAIAVAFNQIVKKADNCDFLFALDQDTEINVSQIKKLKDYINQYYQNDIGIYCPDIYFSKKDMSDSSIVDIDFTITSCSMINISVFKKINGYDEKIFLDGVDRDFCFRLRNSGYRIKKVGSVKVRQHLGNDKKSILGVYEHSPLRNYYIAYNRRYFINKFPNYFKNWNKIKYLYLSEGKQLLNVAFFEKDKLSKMRSILKGISDYKHDKLGVKK